MGGKKIPRFRVGAGTREVYYRSAREDRLLQLHSAPPQGGKSKTPRTTRGYRLGAASVLRRPLAVRSVSCGSPWGGHVARGRTGVSNFLIRAPIEPHRRGLEYDQNGQPFGIDPPYSWASKSRVRTAFTKKCGARESGTRTRPLI